MNWKDRILANIKGDKVDRLPFVPRLDVWYRHNKTAGTLPKKYYDATLDEIIEDIDIGYHAVIPDFSKASTGEKSMGFALGIPNINTLPYRIDFSGLDFKIITLNGITEIIINTPYGQIKTRTIYDDKIRNSGVTSPAVIEKAIKDPRDYKAAAYIFTNIGVKTAYNEFLDFERSIGNRGIAVAWNLGSASPMHLIMMHLMPFESFIQEFNDNQKELEWLASKIDGLYQEIFRITLESPAKIILSGANYDSFLTWPPFFKKYITPYLKRLSERSHSEGKYFMTHTDGENDGLLEEYINSGIDIADSICPLPMTKLNIKEIREVFGNKITIWGGLPSICTIKESMPDSQFERYINKWFEDIGKGQKLIISFADTTPPSADFKRILLIAKLAKGFGPVEPLRY